MTRFASSLLIPAATALIGFTAPALAAPIEPIDAPHTAYRIDNAQADPEKKLCAVEADAIVTGTMLKHRVCKTRAEWQAEGAQIVRK